MNAVILISVLSIGVASVYGGYRTITALYQHGYSPKFFIYIDSARRLLPPVAAVAACRLLAYINYSILGP
jgi:amino acid transporter